MSSTLGLNLVNWLQGISLSIGFELIGRRLIDILNICLVIRNVRDSILFQLGRSGLIDIGDIHIVSTLESLLIAVGFNFGAFDVFDV